MPRPGRFELVVVEGDGCSESFSIREDGAAKVFAAGTTAKAEIRRDYATPTVLASLDVDVSGYATGAFIVSLSPSAIAALDAIDFATVYGATPTQADIELGVWAFEVRDGGTGLPRTYLVGPVTYIRKAT